MLIIQPSDLLKYASTADNTVNTAQTVFAAQGAGVFTYIDTIMVTNAHPTQGTWVEVIAGSTVIATGYADAKGGWMLPLAAPLRSGANEAITYKATTAATLRATISGFKNVI